MRLLEKLRAFVKGLTERPPVETTTFEYPDLPATFLKLPDLPSLPTLPGMTVHTTTVITENVECSTSSTPEHAIQIVIIDNVVKAIKSPCDIISARATAQLGGESCAQRRDEIICELKDEPVPHRSWTQSWLSHEREDSSLKRAVSAASARRSFRRDRRLAPASERTPPQVWERYIKHVTGLAAKVIVDKGAHIYVETPGVASTYNLCGRGTPTDPFMWALGQGPGDQRVYDLLNKHVKITVKLVRYL